MSPGLKCQVGSSPELQGLRGDHLSASQPPSSPHKDVMLAKADSHQRLQGGGDCSIFSDQTVLFFGVSHSLSAEAKRDGHALD